MVRVLARARHQEEVTRVRSSMAKCRTSSMVDRRPKKWCMARGDSRTSTRHVLQLSVQLDDANARIPASL